MSDRRTGKRARFKRESARQCYESSLRSLFDTFYGAKIAEGRSERTLATYRENFRFFCDFLTENEIELDVREISSDVIRSYITWMLGTKRKWEGHAHKNEKDKTVGLSPVTVNTRLKPLRTLFNYLKENGLIETNAFEKVPKVKEPETDIKILSVEQLKKLLNTPDKRSYAGFRDFVIMNLLIDSFMRIGELVSIKKSDIDFEVGVLTLSAKLTKSRRSRIVPLQKSTLKLIKELILECDDFSSDYVFLTNYGEPVTTNHIRCQLKKHARSAGLQIRIYPHLFRHTAATLFLENGGDMRHLQKILGHADMRTIIKYTHLSQRSIINQHEQYSPLKQVIDPLNKDRKILR